MLKEKVTSVRRFLSILLGLGGILSLCSCYKEQGAVMPDDSKPDARYTCLVVDVGNDGFGIETEYEYTFSSKYYPSDAAPSELTVKFDTKEYTGKYTFTGNTELVTSEKHFYECDNGTIFSVFTDDLTLASITLLCGDYSRKQPYRPDLDETALAEVKKKALALASEYIRTSDYILVEEDPITRTAEEASVTIYRMYFVKTVDGIETTDFCAVEYDSKGDITGFQRGDIGAFDAYRGFRIQEDQCEAAISSKVDAVFLRSGVKSVSHEIIGKQKLYMLDGKLVLKTRLAVDVFYSNPEDHLDIRTGIMIATIFD